MYVCVCLFLHPIYCLGILQRAGEVAYISGVNRLGTVVGSCSYSIIVRYVARLEFCVAHWGSVQPSPTQPSLRSSIFNRLCVCVCLGNDALSCPSSLVDTCLQAPPPQDTRATCNSRLSGIGLCTHCNKLPRGGGRGGGAAGAVKKRLGLRRYMPICHGGCLGLWVAPPF